LTTSISAGTGHAHGQLVARQLLDAGVRRPGAALDLQLRHSTFNSSRAHVQRLQLDEQLARLVTRVHRRERGADHRDASHARPRASNMRAAAHAASRSAARSTALRARGLAASSAAPACTAADGLERRAGMIGISGRPRQGSAPALIRRA
jgi:hypothetical protein